MRFSFILLLLLVCCQRQTGAQSDRVPLQPFFIAEATASEYQSFLPNGESLNSRYRRYDGSLLPHNDDDPDRIYFLVTKFVPASPLANDRLFLHIPPLAYPCEIYCNQRFIAQTGNTKSKYVSSEFFGRMTSLGTIQPNDTNTLMVIIRPRGERVAFTGFQIGTYTAISEITFWRTFFNYTGITGFFIVSGLLFILFFFLWLSSGFKNINYLLFALTTLTMQLAFIIIPFGYPLASEVLLWKISRICITLTAPFLMLFALKYLNKVTKPIMIALGTVCSAALIAFLFCDSKHEIAQVFAITAKFIVFPSLLTSLVVISAVFARHRNRNNTILLLGMTLMILSGCYDLYYDLIHYFPYAWMTPYGYLALELCISLTFAFDQGTMVQTILKQSRQLEQEIGLRTHAQEELQQLNTELEGRVSQRTKELEFTVKELESFNASVSHDLRIPLTGIAGYTSLLQEGYASQLDDEGQDFIHAIDKCVTRMTTIIDELLALSRVSVIPLNRTDLDLAVVSVDIFKDISAGIKNRSIQFITAPRIPVKADANLLSIAMQNLIGNAVKYSSKTIQPRIEVGVREEQGHCLYYIRDNGVGFDMNKAGKLFGAFVRLHHPDEFEGIGIGLSIVKRIISKHSGKIWAESSPGHGAVFYFTLPTPGSPS